MTFIWGYSNDFYMRLLVKLSYEVIYITACEGIIWLSYESIYLIFTWAIDIKFTWTFDMMLMWSPWPGTLDKTDIFRGSSGLISSNGKLAMHGIKGIIYMLFFSFFLNLRTQACVELFINMTPSFVHRVKIKIFVIFFYCIIMYTLCCEYHIKKNTARTMA